MASRRTFGSFAAMVVLIGAAGCSFVGDVLTPRDADPSSAEAGAETHESDSATFDGSDSQVSADTSEAGDGADDAPAEVTDVGGDAASASWGESGEQGGFDTGMNDEIGASIAQCEQRCEREVQCGWLAPGELEPCKSNCVPTVFGLDDQGGYLCVQSFTNLNACLVAISCAELAQWNGGRPGGPCEPEQLEFEASCFY